MFLSLTLNWARRERAKIKNQIEQKRMLVPFVSPEKDFGVRFRLSLCCENEKKLILKMAWEGEKGPLKNKDKQQKKGKKTNKDRDETGARLNRLISLGN